MFVSDDYTFHSETNMRCDVDIELFTLFTLFTLRCSHCARHRTTSGDIVRCR